MLNKNYSIYGLPEKVKFCKKCTISNQRPSSTVEFKSKNNLKKVLTLMIMKFAMHVIIMN